MTLVMTWGSQSFRSEEVLAASAKVLKVFDDVGLEKPRLKIARGHIRCGYLIFDTVRQASAAMDVYLEIKHEEKVTVGADSETAAIFLGWQRSPTQNDFGRRITAVVEFLKTSKGYDNSDFKRKVEHGLLSFKGDRMIRFEESLRGIEMRTDATVLSKAGVTTEQLNAAIQEHLNRV